MRHDGLDAARDLLRSTFGHADFRGLQAGVIGEVLEAAAVKAVYRGERRISMRRMTVGQALAGLGALHVVEPELAAHLHAVLARDGATFVSALDDAQALV